MLNSKGGQSAAFAVFAGGKMGGLRDASGKRDFAAFQRRKAE